MLRAWLFLGALLGAAGGGYVPLLWGGSLWSLSSVLLSVAGGLAGIWLGFKIDAAMED
jgi:hypothetical protein